MVEAHMTAYGCLHLLFKYQGDMIPDTMEKGAFGFPHIEGLTFTHHYVHHPMLAKIWTYTGVHWGG